MKTPPPLGSPALSEGDVNSSKLREKWWREEVDAETRALLDEDARYFLHQSLSSPCLNVLRRCSGAYLEDHQGRRYLDFHGNNVHQVGFGNAEVVEAIVRQIQELPFSPRRYTNRPAIQLARKLTELAPGDLKKVLFAPSGTAAMGMALKLARAVTGRFKTLSMWDAFHGASLDAISIGGEATFRQGAGPLLPGTEHIPPPDARHCPWGCAGNCNLKCADYVEYVLEKEPDIGAVIGETVRCTPYIPHPDYWKRIRAACDRHGALLILDEIPICLGRTGRMFAFEHYDIVPDIVVLGKGLGGGVLPLAAMLTRASFDVAGDRALGHYTHEKNPVLCAAGVATISYLENHHVLQNVREVGEFGRQRLLELQKRHPIVGDVRGLGLLLGLELMRPGPTVARATAEAEAVMYAALRRGLSFKVTMGNILTLTPPLTLTKAEMAKAVDILDESLAALPG